MPGVYLALLVELPARRAEIEAWARGIASDPALGIELSGTGSEG